MILKLDDRWGFDSKDAYTFPICIPCDNHSLSWWRDGPGADNEWGVYFRISCSECNESMSKHTLDKFNFIIGSL